MIGLEARLKKALAGKSPADLNAFQFLSLDMVKAETADRWIEVRKKVYNVAAHFVEKRLGEDDVLVRCRGGFILIFAHLSGRAAEDRLATISQDINIFFLGDRILCHLDISSSPQTLDATAFARVMREHADEALLDGRRRSDPKSAAARAGGETGEAHWKAGDMRDASSAPAVDAANTGRPAPRTPDATKIERPSDRMAWKTSAQARHPHRESEPVLSARPAVPQQAWDDIVFRPCWDVTPGEIAANICLARKTRGQVTRYGRDTFGGQAPVEAHRDLDRAVAVAAQRGFLKLHTRGEVCIVAIPVHYETIRSVQDRIGYFSILQSVPQHLRCHFFLRVDDIPPGAPMGQMQEIFRSMKIFGSHLLATVPFEQTDLGRFEGCRIDIFGCHLPQRLRTDPASEADIELMRQRAKKAAAMHAGTALIGVDRFDVLASGVSAGVKTFAGHAIGPVDVDPAPTHPISFGDLHANYLSRQNSAA